MTSATDQTPDMEAVLGDDVECAARLQSMWSDADMPARYPAGTDEVVELLRSGGGFDASIELLENWCRSGMVPNVKIRAGKFSWLPTNILCAAIQMDTWRRFIALHPKHIHRLTGVELAEAQANAAGSTCFTDLKTFDLNAFVEVISRCADNNMRLTFAVALKTKLRSLGVLDK
jgi:hypothetical protein